MEYTLVKIDNNLEVDGLSFDFVDQWFMNIRKQREELNFSQEYMADSLGIVQSSYAKIEKGHAKLSVERLIKIAEIFEVDPDDILKGNIRKPGESSTISSQKKVDKSQINADLISENQFLKQLLEEKENRIKDKEELLKHKEEIIGYLKKDRSN